MVGAILFWTWAAIKSTVTLVGASTVGDDLDQLMYERLPRWADWLFSTPWWVPAILAFALTTFLIWLSWPRHTLAMPPSMAPVQTNEPGLPPASEAPANNVVNTNTVVSDALSLDPKGLYVGLMTVAVGNMKDSGTIEIAARCFNASGSTISIRRIEGNIAVSEKSGASSQQAIGNLPQPWIVEGQGKPKTSDIQNNSEFLLLLEQRVTPEIAAKIDTISDDHNLSLDLDGLNVLVSKPGERECYRIPLWNGIRLYRDANWLISGQIVAVKLQPIRIRVS